MGLRMTLGLVGVVAGLGAILWFTDRQPPIVESASVPALDGRSLPDCKRMRWQFSNLPPIEISRGKDGEFSLTEPVIDLASHAYLRQIVSAWDTAQLLATDYQDDFKGRQETGLEPPEVTFVAEWPDGHRIAYDIGGQGPLGTDRFMRRDGKIWRGGTGIYDSMRVNVDDLRERAVFRTMEPQCAELRVEQVLITGKREVLHLQRGPGGEWRMQAPFIGRAAAGASVQFVTAVLSLRADEFLPGHVRLPKGDPVVVILVRGGRGEETLSLWEDQGTAYGQLPGRMAWFQSDPRPYAAVFQNAVGNLRARVLVPLENVAVDLAEVVNDPGQGRGDRIHLVRDEGADWRLVEPINHPAHPTPCGELMQAINNLHAIEFVDGATAGDERFGLGTTRRSVSVRGFRQQAATNIWLGADAGRADVPLHYACRADETGTVVLVPKPAVEQLQQPWTAYCARDVVKLTVPIERIELQPRGPGEPRVFRAEGGHWQQDGKPGNRDEVGDFAADVLCDLRGKAAIDMRGGTFGEPNQVVRLCRGKGDELAKLRIWDRGKELPLLVQPWAQTVVGFELGTRDGNSLRELFQ